MGFTQNPHGTEIKRIFQYNPIGLVLHFIPSDAFLLDFQPIQIVTLDSMETIHIFGSPLLNFGGYEIQEEKFGEG